MWIPLETPPAGPKCQYYQGRVQKVAQATSYTSSPGTGTSQSRRSIRIFLYVFRRFQFFCDFVGNFDLQKLPFRRLYIEGLWK